MKVTLAYPYTDADGKAHEPDATVDLADDVATQLVRDGRARTADAAPTRSK